MPFLVAVIGCRCVLRQANSATIRLSPPPMRLSRCWNSRGRRVRDVAEALQENPAVLEELTELTLAEYPEWAELLLFIDQFEELFTVVDERYRDGFVSLLGHAAKSPKLRIVTTLRADFYHRCVERQLLAELLRTGSYPLAAPGVGALFDMIERPAVRAGLRFEHGLAQRMVDDTGGEPGALALLAFALAELYQAKTEEGELTEAAYQAFGGLRGAIAQRAEATFSALKPAEQATLNAVFRELIEVEEAESGWVATRRRTPLNEVAPTPAAQKLVETFTEARLLQRDEEGERPIVEVAHEALLRNWPRLVEWINSAGDDLPSAAATPAGGR